MMQLRILAVLCLMIGGAAVAEQPVSDAAARRFPQPVRVGDLIHRRVLQPVASMPTLGFVREVVHAPDGSIEIVVDYGGFLGLFTRPIAVPVDAMGLLGQFMVVVGYTPRQLDGFKSFAPDGTQPLPADNTIDVGLSSPSH